MYRFSIKNLIFAIALLTVHSAYQVFINLKEGQAINHLYDLLFTDNYLFAFLVLYLLLSVLLFLYARRRLTA